MSLLKIKRFKKLEGGVIKRRFEFDILKYLVYVDKSCYIWLQVKCPEQY